MPGALGPAPVIGWLARACRLDFLSAAFQSKNEGCFEHFGNYCGY